MQKIYESKTEEELGSDNLWGSRHSRIGLENPLKYLQIGWEESIMYPCIVFILSEVFT